MLTYTDPKQLPPTVISEQVAQYQYNESLFVRIAKRDEQNMHLLRYVPLKSVSFHSADRTAFNTECTRSYQNYPRKCSTTVNSKMVRGWQSKQQQYGTNAIPTARTDSSTSTVSKRKRALRRTILQKLLLPSTCIVVS